jgi:hypothetical protein
VVILGIVLGIVGYFARVELVETIGVILVIVGAVAWTVSAASRPVRRRRA